MTTAHLVAAHEGVEDIEGQVVASGLRRRTSVLLVVAVAVVAVVWLFALEVVKVQSSSMSPTINDGAHLAVDKLTFRFRDPQRGEVVIAHHPESGKLVVKRVVAVGGDSVGIDDGRLTVNGEFVDEPYADLAGMPGRYFGPDTVPADHVFLLGDQRAESDDSRAFGPVNVDGIIGRAMGVP